MRLLASALPLWWWSPEQVFPSSLFEVNLVMPISAENSDLITVSNVDTDETSNPSAKPYSAGWVLTPGPIRSFYDEYSRLASIGQHFSFINTTLCTFLEYDSQADRVRRFLAPFNKQMCRCVSSIQEGLTHGRITYTHNQAELTDDKFPDPVTDEHAQTLLDEYLQGLILANARKTAGYFADAAMSLREALNCLPDFERELLGFVDGYSERSRISNERSQSWVPFLVQDFFLGPVSPPTLDASQVEVLPQDLSTASKLLGELPNFFDRISEHFTRLSELKQSEIASLGYSSLGDLRRLYSDRLTCNKYILEMDTLTWEMDRAFAYGDPSVIKLRNRSK